jgi:membrane associated rhomboid family serine protease
MQIYNKAGSFFERPGLTTNILLAANFAAFMLCYFQGAQFKIPLGILYEHGAMYPGVVRTGQYWRLFAAGFLHADPIHLVLNMICLVSWGGLLERRVGTFNFIVIYFSSLVAGNVVSLYGHPGNFIGVGASGALSGLVGALLCLFILDKISLSGQFFLGAIGLNVVLMSSVPRIDWWNHLGGFAAGLICCAVIDLLAKLNNVLLRCKFPEFVKLNLLFAIVLVATAAAQLDSSGFPGGLAGLSVVVCAIALVMIKLIDLLLSAPRGLAMAVICFAIVYAIMPVLLRQPIATMMARNCVSTGLTTSMQGATIGDQFLAAICPYLTWIPYLLALLLPAATIVLLHAPLTRGLRDVGFINAGLRADRSRCQGI